MNIIWKYVDYIDRLYLVAIPPRNCSADPINFSFKVDNQGNVSMEHENGIAIIGAHVNSKQIDNSNIAFYIPVECDCSVTNPFCYDCWGSCAPYCDPGCRKKVYMGVWDDYCVQGRLPLCRFDLVCEDDPYQTVYHYTTGYPKIQPLNLRCETWYRVEGTYFGSNYQNTPIEFRLKVENGGDVQIEDEYGILSSIRPYIIVSKYNEGYMAEILMPVIPQKQTRIQIVDKDGEGVPNYTFLLGNASDSEKIEGIYTTDNQGYTPVMTLRDKDVYYIGEIDISSYNYNLIGRYSFENYIAHHWTDIIQLYLKSEKCGLKMGREPHFPTPEDISCSSGVCTFVYKEPERIIHKEIFIKKTATTSNGELIADAVFRLNNTMDYATGYNGMTSSIIITNEQAHLLQEIKVPAGFLIDNRKMHISMNNTGVIEINSQVNFNYDPVNRILTVINQRGCAGSSFMVKKQDADSKEPLEGAGIEYYKNTDRNNALGNSRTDASGYTHVMTMECNQTYYIKEIFIPSGYKTEHPAFAVVKVDGNGNLEIIEEEQLMGWLKVDDKWVFTFVNHKSNNNNKELDSIDHVPGCSGTYAYDNTINARYGFRQSSKEKLSKIVIFYKDSCVRTYTFCYGEDFFGRAQLQAISQWGSEDTLEAYTHTFEYHNDVGTDRANLFQQSVSLSITDNEADNDPSKRIAKKLRNFFLKGFVSPSVLGGSRTWSTGINTGADIGLFPAFPLKTLSAGLYVNASISSSKGKTTMIDINGDGLPDRVYNVMEGVKNKTYYLLQKPNRGGFEQNRQLLNGISTFLEDFSDNASIGLQASAGVHGGIQKGFLGNSWTNVYFADMNGDGFMDLVSSSGVKQFGKHQQPYAFTFPDCLPPIITTKVDTIEVHCDTNFNFTPEIYERDRSEELRYDLVRVWQADLDCNDLSDLTYSICAPLHLADDSIALENFCGLPDSVIASIEYYGKGLTGKLEHILLWSDVIGDSDTTNHGTAFCDLTVKPGPDPVYEPDENVCPVMLRKADYQDNPLGNVVFNLKGGPELITNADNDGRTPVFYMTEDCIIAWEASTLPHCTAFPQAFNICKKGVGEDCEITVNIGGQQVQGFDVSKKWINGRDVHVITVRNECYNQPMCFARIKKIDQNGNPLENVQFRGGSGSGEFFLTTNKQGLTSLFNIFSEGCSIINECQPLSDCNVLSMSIGICADDNCNIQIVPDNLNYTTEWLNGMLVHTITIVNQCKDNMRIFSGDEIVQNMNIEHSTTSSLASSSEYVNSRYDLSALKLCKGDKLFFRVRPQNNGVKKKVVWDPAILPYSPSLSRTEYLDENGRIFGGGNKASESQLLQGDSLFFCPAKGEIVIESVINPLPFPLTDNVEFEIWVDNYLLYHYFIPAGGNTSTQNNTFTLNVNDNSTLKFKVSCKSNINMHEIQWYPVVYYNYLNYGSEMIDAVIDDDNGERVRMLEYVIAPYHDFYHKSIILNNNYLHKIYNTPPSYQYVSRKLSRFSIETMTNGKAYITIKQRGRLLFSKEMPFKAGQTNEWLNNTYIPIIDDPDVPVYISCYVDDPALFSSYFDCFVTIDNYRYPAVIYTKYKRDVLFGEFYGGWGQFLYQTDSIPNKNPFALMDINKLKWLSTLDADNITHYVDTSRMGGDSIRDLRTFSESANYDSRMAEVRDALFCIPMFNDPENKGHVGYYANAFIRGADMNIGGIPCPDYFEEENEPCDNLLTTASNGGEKTGTVTSEGGDNEIHAGIIAGGNVIKGMDLKKTSSSQNTSYTAGMSLPGISIGLNESSTTTKQNNDLMDLNGDGFPDIIRKGSGVYYSFPQAAVWETSPTDVFGGQSHHETKTTTYGSSFTADPMGFISVAKNSNKGPTVPTKSKEGGGAPNITGSHSATRSEDETLHTLIDINGDGLPDRVYNSGKNVALNLGYSFESAEFWGEMGEIMKNVGNAYSNSLGIGGGKEFAGGSKSYSGGISGSKSYSQTKEMLADINGDGLPDKVVIANERTLYIHYNTGCGFNGHYDTITLDASDPALYEWSTTQNKGANFGITLGFPIVWFAKVSCSGGADVSFSLSSSNIQFMDMDGDGYADLVMAPNDKTLLIRYSNLGRTGLLKKATNPMGGSIELAYHKTEANVFHSRRWVMDTVKINDNFAGDGADVMMTTYEYDYGYYDRNERAFYGFALVNEKHHDTQNNNAVYRKYNRYYYNNNYYYKGLNLTEEVLSGGDLPYIRTMNKYNHHTLTRNGIVSMYVTLDTTVTCYYEGQANAQIRQEKTWQYETSFGRVTKQTETSTDMPLLEVSINYHPEQNNNYCVAVPSDVTVNSSGQMYRKRTTSINNTGKLTSASDYYSSSNSLTTNMEYDQYGNCTKIIYPNHSYQYTYDNEVHTYPVSIRDTFGCTSYVQKYDFRYGTPLTVIDKSGHYLYYTLDQFGRIIEILAPKEQNQFHAIKIDSAILMQITDPIYINPLLGGITWGGTVIPLKKEYTIKYIYRQGDLKASPPVPYSAFTYHYDPANEGSNIKTYTYSDGLGRIIQTKKDAEICSNCITAYYKDGVWHEVRPQSMIVSGKVSYDAFGRSVSTKYPVIENGSSIIFSTVEDAVNPTVTSYDIMDRPLIQTAPDGTTVNYNYDFGNDISRGYTLFETKVTDQNGNISTSLSNVNKQQFEVQPAGHSPVWFTYNAIGDLLKVEGIDFSRSYLYDDIGRKTEYKEDSLQETYTYNGVNLVEKKRYWNENGSTQQASITYTYDNDRIMTMKSSEYQDAIEYTYNNKGKLDTIKDASGIQVLKYGNMGEVTSQTRIYTLPFMDQAIKIETKFEYDSWGRILNMTYPDDEKVTYEYDYGGQLKKMKGSKKGHDYTYIEKIQYNKFGSKTLVEYGNNLTTAYSYNSQNLRLNGQSVINAGLPNPQRNYLNTVYTHDNKGNITGINTTNFKMSAFSFSETFTYDAADQLTQASGNTDSLYNLNITYGNYGRINTYNSTFTDPQTNVVQQQNSSFTYPNINIPSTTFAPESSDSTLYTYGINGSLRSKGNEYYLFNAFDQMKAYSNKGKTYSYYGYDDAGQRMYKATLNNTISRTNTIEGAVWEVEKLMLYPNGYININQDGNYTKHYYVDDQRIASKIGSGFSNSISDGIVQNNSVFASMEEELGKVFILNDTMSNIYYPFDTITKLNGSDPEGIEDELYFYHGNHLSSTQMITDITGSITQQILYAPFGEIVSEYNAYWKMDTIPSFRFNGKQFDEETGMYYYETRYYNPPTFISRDPRFEKYFWCSPYTYCANNPLIFIDPTGREVEITGTEQKAAFKEMKKGAAQHDIKLKMDKNGQISGTYTGKGEISTEGKQILDAVNDKSVKVNINATDQNTTAGGHPFFGGAFLGSTLTSESTATARQDINPADLKAMSNYYGKPGQDMLHEVTEAYQGGLLAIQIGKSVGNSVVDKSNFDIAHARAIPQSGIINEGLITQNGRHPNFDTTIGKYWYVDHPRKGRIEFKEWLQQKR